MDRLTDTAAQTFPTDGGGTPLQKFTNLSFSPRPDFPRPFLLPFALLSPFIALDDELERQAAMFPERRHCFVVPESIALAMTCNKMILDQIVSGQQANAVWVTENQIKDIQTMARAALAPLTDHYKFIVGCETRERPAITPLYLDDNDRPPTWQGRDSERALLAFITKIHATFDHLDRHIWHARQDNANPRPANDPHITPP